MQVSSRLFFHFLRFSGTVDDTGGIVGEMGEAGLVEDTTLLFG